MKFFLTLSEYFSLALPVLACFLVAAAIGFLMYLKKRTDKFFYDIARIANGIERRNDRRDAD